MWKVFTVRKAAKRARNSKEGDAPGTSGAPAPAGSADTTATGAKPEKEKKRHSITGRERGSLRARAKSTVSQIVP